ncbi:hypothetical protein [Agromyces sp. GXS1127]|uniref:hypothetical protein n=1 Tax=Agromyces sp. GXS1127 TaxID=3424181 RepID=UPI003D31D845
MNKRTAATVIVTGSLALLIGSGTASAAWGGPVREDRVPSVVGLARGHVIIRDDLSPAAVSGPISAAVERVAQAPGFNADARRELHASLRTSAATPFSADQLRELRSVEVPSAAAPLSAEKLRELHSAAVPGAQSAIGADARRELHSMGTTAGSAEMQGDRLAEYAEAMNASSTSGTDAQGQRLTAYAEAMQELHAEGARSATAVTDEGDDLSPLRSGR